MQKSENRPHISNVSFKLYDKPYKPKQSNRSEVRVYNKYLAFFNTTYNTKFKKIKFECFDVTLKHWVTNKGDDIVVENSGYGKGKLAGILNLKIVGHTQVFDRVLTKRDFKKIDESEINIEKNRPHQTNRDGYHGKRKNNPIIKDGIKLNRARVVAIFFVENPDNFPFVAVIDGDVNNLHSDNLFWTDKNMYPELNEVYEHQEINNEVVIHSPAIRTVMENMNFYGWEKVYTKVNVPIPNDLMEFFNQWKVSIQSAVFTSLRFLTQWSFVVYAIEVPSTNEVFVGYSPAIEGVYSDVVLKVASQMRWLNDILNSEGYGSVKHRYLNLSVSRTEAHDLCIRFMNEYNNKKWKIVNADFYHESIERQLSISIRLKELEAVNEYLLKKRGYELEKYLDKVVDKLIKDSEESNE